MTTVLRGAIEVAPMSLVLAPEPGTGKSYLINLCATIATGRIAPAIACSENEEEMDKRLTAAAISAIPIVHLNNLTADLKSGLLCEIITDKLVGLRLFHTNDKYYELRLSKDDCLRQWQRCNCRGRLGAADSDLLHGCKHGETGNTDL